MDEHSEHTVELDVATEPTPPGSRLYRIASRELLVCKPNQRQFGHFALEMLFALSFARLRGCPVIFLADKARRTGESLFEVDSDDVKILRTPGVRWLGRLLWLSRDLRLSWPTSKLLELRELTVDELRDYLRSHPDLSGVTRKHLGGRRKSLQKKMRAAGNVERAARGAYNRRRLTATRIPTRLTGDAQKHALAVGEGFGIAPDAKIVTVHVRERGYKIGLELQDKGDPRDDSVRNASVETHFAAIDYLIESGYTVVRVGDPSMTPVIRRGVVDLATSAERDPLFELSCVFRSRFILCGESGPFSLSFLTNTPLLAVNATEPVGAFPLRADGLYLLKTVIDRGTRRPLGAHEFLSEDYLANSRNTLRFEYVENTSEQILDAVKEMTEVLEGAPETPAQTWYREELLRAAMGLQHLAYIRKWGPDEGFLGYGRLARVQAEAWYHACGRDPGATDELALEVT